jgi:hypothetical protein
MSRIHEYASLVQGQVFGMSVDSATANLKVECADATHRYWSAGRRSRFA